MKKLNLNNQVLDDDEKLISILKSRIDPKPSEQFVESTLEKFFILEKNRRIVHKPLRTPIYFMFAIGTILLAPVLIAIEPQAYSIGLGVYLSDFVQNIFFQIDMWYVLTSIFLVLVLLSVLWIEMPIFKFRSSSI